MYEPMKHCGCDQCPERKETTVTLGRVLPANKTENPLFDESERTASLFNLFGLRENRKFDGNWTLSESQESKSFYK